MKNNRSFKDFMEGKLKLGSTSEQNGKKIEKDKWNEKIIETFFIQMLETMKQMEIQIHGKLTSQKTLFSRILFSKIKTHSVSFTKASD